MAKLCPFLESLRALEFRSLHQESGALVKTLQVRSRYVPVCKKISKWLEKLSKHSTEIDSKSPLPEELMRLRDQTKLCDLQQRYDIYPRHLGDQKAFQELSLAGLSLVIIPELTRFPNLSRMEFQAQCYPSGGEGRELTGLRKRLS